MRDVPDPMTQAVFALIPALTQPYAAEVPCPVWCGRGDGCNFRESDDDSAWPLVREHETATTLFGVGFNLVQVEHAMTARGPVLRSPVTAWIALEQTATDDLSAEQLRALGHEFYNLANKLAMLAVDPSRS